MAVAHLIKERSTCDRTKVGAVFALESRILATGYNGAPAGMEHCDHACKCENIRQALNDQTYHLKGCPQINPCTRAVHAEANGVAFAARNGIKLEGCDVYTTMSPCVPCAQLLINAGVRTVYYADVYRITDGVVLLERANIRTGLLA